MAALCLPFHRITYKPGASPNAAKPWHPWEFLASPALCPCGSPLPEIEVVGRTDDALMMQGNDGGNVTLQPLALATVLEELAQSQGLAPIEVIGKSGVTLTRGHSGKVQRVIAFRQKKPSHQDWVNLFRATLREVKRRGGDALDGFCSM